MVTVGSSLNASSRLGGGVVSIAPDSKVETGGAATGCSRLGEGIFGLGTFGLGIEGLGIFGFGILGSGESGVGVPLLIKKRREDSELEVVRPSSFL